MKKKIRRILVEDTYYVWAIQERLWPKGYLKVWIEGKKAKPCLVIELLLSEAVTPSFVLSKIQQARKKKSSIRSK